MRRFLAAGGTALACKLFDGFRVKAIAVAGLLLILAAGYPGQSAFAQGTTFIPPPPSASGASRSPDPNDPTHAFSPTTGQNFHWDCNKNTWIDSKTGEPVPGGFGGPRDGDGKPIPPPPSASGASRSPDPNDPTHAFSPTTGQNMHWDRDQQTWRDSKTGQPVPGGFGGPRVKDDCPPPSTATTPAPAGVGLLIVEPGAFFDLIEDADARTAGVPKPSEETQKLEEKKQPSWWETLVPALIPEIGIGGRREDRERRFPDDPRR